MDFWVCPAPIITCFTLRVDVLFIEHNGFKPSGNEMPRIAGFRRNKSPAGATSTKPVGMGVPRPDVDREYLPEFLFKCL
jgi:hypothetical protein